LANRWLAGREARARDRIWPYRQYGRRHRRRVIGDWLLPRLGIQLGAGIIGAIVNATIGAAILLFLMRFAQGQGWDKR
jgi:hypothetical protein